MGIRHCARLGFFLSCLKIVRSCLRVCTVYVHPEQTAGGFVEALLSISCLPGAYRILLGLCQASMRLQRLDWGGWFVVFVSVDPGFVVSFGFSL